MLAGLAYERAQADNLNQLTIQGNGNKHMNLVIWCSGWTLIRIIY